MNPNQGAWSLFAGLTPDDQRSVTSRLVAKTFPAGTFLVTEGEQNHALYIVQSGIAQVLLSDTHGRRRPSGHLGEGSVVGATSVLAGEPETASIQALTDVQALEMDEAEFTRAANAHPVLYRQLAALLSREVSAAELWTLAAQRGELSAILNAGAPPLLGYALACSIAWHLHAPVVLLVAGERAPGPLAAIGRPLGQAGHEARAWVELTEGKADTPDALREVVDELRLRYAYVLVQQDGTVAADLEPSHIVLATDSAPAAAAHLGDHDRTLVGWSERWTRRAFRRDRPTHVPPLSPADEAALDKGLLPPSGDVGQALGALARDLTGLRVGLALGAGGPRGYVHIGVIRALTRLSVPVDCVAGTSVGSFVAAGLASGRNHDELGAVLDEVGKVAWHLTVSSKCISSSSRVRAGVQRLFGDARIEDLPLPLAMVAADVLTGEEILLREGLVWPAIMASTAIPGIYPAQTIGRHVLVDGGVVNPVPASAAFALGADVVVAVDIAKHHSAQPAELEASLPAETGPSTVHSIMRSIEIMQTRIAPRTQGHAVIGLEIPFDNVELPHLRDFTQGRNLIPLGEEAVNAALPQLQSALPWLSDVPEAVPSKS